MQQYCDNTRTVPGRTVRDRNSSVQVITKCYVPYKYNYSTVTCELGGPYGTSTVPVLVPVGTRTRVPVRMTFFRGHSEATVLYGQDGKEGDLQDSLFSLRLSSA